MEEESVNKKINYKLLYEMACSEGWRDVIAPMLKRDVAFMTTLVMGSPRKDEKTGELIFKVKDIGAYRFAQGQACEAGKVLDKVERACNNHLNSKEKV